MALELASLTLYLRVDLLMIDFFFLKGKHWQLIACRGNNQATHLYILSGKTLQDCRDPKVIEKELAFRAFLNGVPVCMTKANAC